MAIPIRHELTESDFDEPAVLIKITGADPSKMSSYDLYDRVRGEWAASLDRMRNVRLALGVCEGRAIEVYRVAGWFYAGEVMRQDEGFVSADGRIEFVGNLASEALRRRYKDRLVTDLFHGQNPIKYVGGA